MSLKSILFGSVFALGLSVSTVANASTVSTSARPFGVGLILGDPSALNFKYEADARTAYDLGLAFNLSQRIFQSL